MPDMPNVNRNLLQSEVPPGLAPSLTRGRLVGDDLLVPRVRHRRAQRVFLCAPIHGTAAQARRSQGAAAENRNAAWREPTPRSREPSRQRLLQLGASSW